MISEYDISIVHRAYRSHSNANSLSRKPCTQRGREEAPWGERGKADHTKETIEKQGVRVVTVEPVITKRQWRDAQLEDPSIQWMLHEMEKSKSRPCRDDICPQPGAVKAYWLLWDQLDQR